MWCSKISPLLRSNLLSWIQTVTKIRQTFNFSLPNSLNSRFNPLRLMVSKISSQTIRSKTVQVRANSNNLQLLHPLLRHKIAYHFRILKRVVQEWAPIHLCNHSSRTNNNNKAWIPLVRPKIIIISQHPIRSLKTKPPNLALRHLSIRIGSRLGEEVVGTTELELDFQLGRRINRRVEMGWGKTVFSRWEVVGVQAQADPYSKQKGIIEVFIILFFQHETSTL